MITTTFDTGLDGWTLIGGGSLSFDAAGGNPDGSARAVESGSSVYTYAAPATYLGDRGDFYGGTLSFDLEQDSTASQFDSEDVILRGDGLAIALDAGANPGTDWTSYSVELGLGAGWKIDDLDGRVATEAEIRAVLSDLTAIEIRGEFVVGTTGDGSRLDNVALVAAPTPEIVPQGTTVSSTFDTDTEGWTFIEDVREFRHVATGGNTGNTPDGYLEVVDFATGETWYFGAAEKFLGNKIGFLGGTLSFDLQQSTSTSQFDNEDIRLVGAGRELVYDLSPNPAVTPDWTSYSVTLDDTDAWFVDDLTGVAATEADFLAVLADLDEIYIRGEYVFGNDTGGIDNATLTARDADVRLFDGAVTQVLLDSFDDFAAAESAAGTGQAILIEDAAGFSGAPYALTTEDLTVFSDVALSGAVLSLDGVADITLVGTTDLGVAGNDLANVIIGSNGANTIEGARGNDRIEARGGDDIVTGNRDDDTIDGGSGSDTIDGAAGNDSLIGERGGDRLSGGNGNDHVDGGNANDTMFGGADNDTMLGGAGNDGINGGDGADSLTDGTGRDTLTGGTGADVFDIVTDTNRDKIKDFEDGIDLIRIAGQSFADLTFRELPNGTIRILYAGDELRLLEDAGPLEISDLTASDFLFV